MGSCGLGDTTVIYRYKKDYKMACDGIGRAKHFFREYGLADDYPITIFFEHEAAFNSDEHELEQVLGYFDPVSNYIHLPSYVSRTFKRNNTYSFRDAAENNQDFIELFTSVVAHEVAHLLTLRNSEQKYKFLHASASEERMSSGVQEYIAGLCRSARWKNRYGNEYWTAWIKISCLLMNSKLTSYPTYTTRKNF